MTQLSESLEGIKCCSVQLVFMHTHTQGTLENDSSSVTNDYHLIHLVGAGFFVPSTLWAFIASWIIFAPPVWNHTYVPVIMCVYFCINATNRQLKILPGWIHILYVLYIQHSCCCDTIHTDVLHSCAIASPARQQMYGIAHSAVNNNT